MNKYLSGFLACALAGVLILLSPEASAYVSVAGVDVPTSGASSNPDSVEVQLSLSAGLQIFALPGKTISPVSARSLREMVSINGGSLTLITRLNDGVFELYIEGLTMDFNILPGRGYLINNAQSCTVKFQVDKTAGAIPVNLQRGMNFVSTPVGGPSMASSLLTALQGEGPGSQYVVGMNGGRFQLYYPPLATPDFPVQIGKGYLVSSKRVVTWTPTRVSSKTSTGSPASKAPRSLELEQAIATVIMSPGKGSNRSPILLVIRPTVVSANTTGTLIGLDLDGDTIRYSAASVPNGFVLDAATGRYTWNVRRARKGTYDITFRASDGVNTVTQVGRFIVRKGR